MKRVFVFSLILFAVFLSIEAQKPTQWRGTNSTGVYDETGLLKEWPKSGPAIAWNFEGLGLGFSSPAITEDAIYLSGMDEEEMGNIFALSLEGTLLWKKPYSKEFSDSYDGARSTPVVMGDHLYMYSGYGVITCMLKANGDVVWQKDTQKELEARNIKWGVTETLVIDGDVLYCTPGGETNNIVALNRLDGSLIWSSKGVGDLAAYCTPLLVELPNRKLLVTMMESHIVGLDAKTGFLLWSYDQPNRWSVHANTPLYEDGALVCISGYGKGSVQLKLSKDGSAVEKAWFSEELDGRMGGAVVLDGTIYAAGDKNRVWQALDWASGKQKYTTDEIGKGVVIAADGMLYLYSERGQLALVKPGADGFKVVSSTKVTLGTQQHWAHPVIKNGQLYVRHGDALIAYNIK